jgi:hypothetical protein
MIIFIAFSYITLLALGLRTSFAAFIWIELGQGLEYLAHAADNTKSAITIFNFPLDGAFLSTHIKPLIV